MKRILLLLGLMAAICLGIQAENRTVTDSVNGKKRVIELTDTMINGQRTTDTLSITIYEGSGTYSDDEPYQHHNSSSGLQWVGFNFGDEAPETIIAMTAIIFVFGLPALLISSSSTSATRIGKPNTAWPNRHWPAGNNYLPISSKRLKIVICAAVVSKTSSSASDCSSSCGL